VQHAERADAYAALEREVEALRAALAERDEAIDCLNATIEALQAVNTDYERQIAGVRRALKLRIAEGGAS
jgi:prefoldin subunit 5